MAGSERHRYSYIRAVREVEPSASLERFLAKAARIGNVALGFKDSTFLQWPATPEEELSTDYEPVSEGIGLAAATIYPASKLRYTHFERLVRAEEGLSSALSRTYERVTAREQANKKHIFLNHNRTSKQSIDGESSQLTLRLSNITSSTKPQYASLGEEYALGIEPGQEADTLAKQNQAIFQTIRSMGPGFELCRGQQSSAELAIPFARLPVGAEESQKEKFVSWVSVCLRQQVLQITVGPIEWESRVRLSQSV